MSAHDSVIHIDIDLPKKENISQIREYYLLLALIKCNGNNRVCIVNNRVDNVD